MDFIQPDIDIFEEMGLSKPTDPVVIPEEPASVARLMPVRKPVEKKAPSGDVIKEALAKIQQKELQQRHGIFRLAKAEGDQSSQFGQSVS